MPKYKGDSEDWLDSDESLIRKPRASAPEQVQDLYSDDLTVNAQVTEVFPDRCQVQVFEESNRRLCSYRRSLFKRRGRFRSPVSVGDWVQIEPMGLNDGVLEKIKAPKNRFQRLAPGESDEKPIHVFATNIDQLAIVASAVQPRFVPGVIDRMSIAAYSFQIPIILFVTKMDLLDSDADSDSKSEKEWSHFQCSFLQVIEVSVRSGEGLNLVHQCLDGKKTAFVGHSGVGKTSLLRKILNQNIGRIGEVNPSTGKGRHTTTSSVLYDWKSEQSGGVLIDTPGIREFDLADVTPEQIEAFAYQVIPDLNQHTWSEWIKELESESFDFSQQNRLRGLVKLWHEVQE